MDATIETARVIARWLARGRPGARDTAFLDWCEKTPETAAFRDSIARLALEGSATEWLTCAGIPGEGSLMSELGERIATRFFPSPTRDGDLGSFADRVFRDRASASWLESMPASVAERWTRWITGDQATANLPISAGEALVILSANVKAMGLARDIRERLPRREIHASPFLALDRACTAALPTLFGGSAAGRDISIQECREAAAQCRAAVAAVFATLEESGVSVDLVFRLERIQASVHRIEKVLALAELGPAKVALPFLAELLRARARDRRILSLLSRGTHLLARKVVERAGEIGEHYITSTRAEYGRMLAFAFGGGALTAGTTALKFVVARAGLAPFFEYYGYALNYALSFLLMQALGLKLATKLSASTAATLAARIREESPASFVAEAARITRTQFAALAGNLAGVIPVALAFGIGFRLVSGRDFLDEKAAAYVLHAHDPAGPSIFYATLTGVWLWLASAVAGWVENSLVYRHVPDAIARSARLRAWFGRAAASRLASFARKDAGSAAGNAFLGFALGWTASLGRFFGIGLDVRHVTLSSGAVALAAVTLGGGASGSGGGATRMSGVAAELARAALGLSLIGAMNFAVSFGLSLLIAARAREIRWRELLSLVRAVGFRFLRAPGGFFFPPKGSLTSPTSPSGDTARSSPPSLS